MSSTKYDVAGRLSRPGMVLRVQKGKRDERRWAPNTYVLKGEHGGGKYVKNITRWSLVIRFVPSSSTQKHRHTYRDTQKHTHIDTLLCRAPLAGSKDYRTSLPTLCFFLVRGSTGLKTVYFCVNDAGGEQNCSKADICTSKYSIMDSLCKKTGQTHTTSE